MNKITMALQHKTFYQAVFDSGLRVNFRYKICIHTLYVAMEEVLRSQSLYSFPSWQPLLKTLRLYP